MAKLKDFQKEGQVVVDLLREDRVPEKMLFYYSDISSKMVNKTRNDFANGQAYLMNKLGADKLSKDKQDALMCGFALGLMFAQVSPAQRKPEHMGLE